MMGHEHVVKPIVATPENMRPFGTLVQPTADGVPYSAERDAHLMLGDTCVGYHQILPVPVRFYTMVLQPRPNPLLVSCVTHHKHCTQALASTSAEPWYIVLARPAAPLCTAAELVAFEIRPPDALALHVGTWHAGPLFCGEKPRSFYNLELADTNATDHHSRLLVPPHLLPLRLRLDGGPC